MELLQGLLDIVLHLDRHLVVLLAQFDVWIYAILFLIIFSETGFVITPFLPGDSLLFAVGALAAVDTTGTLSAPLASALLALAAILGNTVNYAIGKRVGPAAFSGRIRFLKVQYLRQTEEFFRRHGRMTIVLSRFVPIVRTCAPFVAGVGRMPYGPFQLSNVAGGLGWVLSLLWAGYFFGNVPFVKNNFGLVTIAIIVASLLPMLIAALRARRRTAPRPAARESE